MQKKKQYLNISFIMNDIRKKISNVWVGRLERSEDVYRPIINKSECLLDAGDIIYKYKDEPVSETEVITMIKNLFSVFIDIPWIEGYPSSEKGKDNLGYLISYFLSSDKTQLNEAIKPLLLNEKSVIEQLQETEISCSMHGLSFDYDLSFGSYHFKLKSLSIKNEVVFENNDFETINQMIHQVNKFLSEYNPRVMIDVSDSIYHDQIII